MARLPLPPLQPPSLPPLLQQGKVQVRAVPLRHLNPVLLLHLRPRPLPHQDLRKQILPLLLRGRRLERLHHLLLRPLLERLRAAHLRDLLLLLQTTVTIPQSHFLNP